MNDRSSGGLNLEGSGRGNSGCIGIVWMPNLYIYAMWERCKAERVSRLAELGGVAPDGTFWLRGTGGPREHEVPAAHACMREQSLRDMRKQSLREPYPDWLRSQPVRPTTSRGAS